MFKIIYENLDFPSFLDVMALVQGLTLSALLLFLNYRHFRSTYYLGVFLMLFSLKLAYFIPKSLMLDVVYPELCLLPFNFSWLLFPLFFIYTQRVSVFSIRKTKYWILIPGIISLIAQVIIYFLPFETKLAINGSLWHELVFTFVGICYSWGIGIWNLRLIHEHEIEVQNTFSQIKAKVLRWARIFLIYSLATSILIHILYLISPFNYYYKIIFSAFDLITIYWVAVNGVIQRNIFSLLNDGASNFSKNASEIDLIKNPIKEDDLKNLMEKIEDYVINSESYARPELTIMDVADNLKTHPKRISTAINTISKQNFNAYINRHRIKKAINLLEKKTAENFSIEGIGLEVGFQSKSAFYSSFKKITGTTPSKYKEKTAA